MTHSLEDCAVRGAQSHESPCSQLMKEFPQPIVHGLRVVAERGHERIRDITDGFLPVAEKPHMRAESIEIYADERILCFRNQILLHPGNMETRHSDDNPLIVTGEKVEPSFWNKIQQIEFFFRFSRYHDSKIQQDGLRKYTTEQLHAVSRAGSRE